jgi:GLPGLI family protein
MKNIVTILSLFIATSLSAQSFQGKAIYKTSRKMNFNFASGNGRQMSDADKEKMQKRLSKQFQKTFVLSFDKTSSVYKEDATLKSPNVIPTGGGNVMVREVGGGGGNDVLFKNIKKDKYLNQTEIMGKRFLIKDKLQTYDWKLTNETKNIGKYTCYKATYTREEERTNMTVTNGEVEEKTEKVDVVTTAWYTPQIPVSNGPRNYHGLPGLIMEVKEGNETIMCTEIVMNPKDKVDIVEPTKGKVVSQEKYRKIMDKKMKETMENFKSRRRNGNNVHIRIGG